MRLSTYYHQSYDGGLNNTSSPREIDRNQASVLHDWLIRYKGQLRRRDGLIQVGSTLSNVPAGLHTFIRTSGVADLLVMDGTSLKYLNSSTFDALDSGFSAGKSFWMETCPLNNTLYIGNEDNYQHSWDRASTTLNSCLTDLGTTIPHGNVMRWHKNHMFVLNNATVSGTVYPHRVYFSNLGTPGTYTTASDYAEVPGDGRLITAMDLGDSLVLFKERSIQFLSGWGVASWAISASASNYANLDERVGCIAPRGVVKVGDEVWFVDDAGQIRRLFQTDFDAFRRDIISTKIQGTLSGINKTQLSKAVAWSNNDFVFFAFPNGSDADNSIVCVYDLIASKRNGGEEAWTLITGWKPKFMADFPTSTVPELYLADTTNKKIYKHDGDDDDGVAIDAIWESKEDDYDKPERGKRLKFGYITGSAGSDVDVGIYASVNAAAYANVGTINLAASGSRLGPTGSFLLGPTGNNTLGGNANAEEKFYFQDGGGAVSGKTVKMKIAHSAVNEQPTVNTFSVHYKLKALR